ncbi:CHAP domain-containing protein [Novosphingobium sp. 1949]|uniref:CHAP domain-containing protein n=1 Tax=Novosphingobium organovorum TaxID=2930092 RepID=A0ABT0BHM1_9SPHN|nr:CHAP domain-containing protein [Novosphingobium organovorum]MCJ2184535.1 CHAP domain-containing protein [Novosphingobium organovorum]
MERPYTALTIVWAAALFALSTPSAQARSAIDAIVGGGAASAPSSAASPPGKTLVPSPMRAAPDLECVPYARELSGIAIYGDAYTWWTKAQGRYARGHVPRVGAVMAIRPYGNSQLGHVATVARVIDSRTILLDHANWSYPGKIERNVTALDVSPDNDWSEVRIWYGPSQTLGVSHWPVEGFIYNARPGSGPVGRALARADDASSPAMRGKASVQANVQESARDPIGAIIAGNF